jgi:hypothetical protein
MAIAQSDLSLKKAENNSDLSTNGGFLTGNAVTASLFPDVSGAERSSGFTRYRKIFLKNEQGTVISGNIKYKDLTLIQAKAYLENISPAEDHISLRVGAAGDTQAEASAYTGWAATGYLDANIAANAVGCEVQMEVNGALNEFFIGGGVIFISDGVNREFFTIATPTFVGPKYTLAFSGGAHTINGYNRAWVTETADIITAGTIGLTTTAMTPDEHIGRRLRIKSASTGSGQVRRIVSNNGTTFTLETPFTTTPTGTVVYEVLKTYVGMCASLGDVVASTSGVVKTLTGTGGFDETQIKLFPVGTKDDQWTLRFATKTTFTVTGVKYGSIGGGSVSNGSPDFRPSTGNSYYFEIPLAAWTGTKDYVVGNTIVFVTNSSSMSFWIKEYVPGGTPAHLANTWDIGVGGDTV